MLVASISPASLLPHLILLAGLPCLLHLEHNNFNISRTIAKFKLKKYLKFYNLFKKLKPFYFNKLESLICIRLPPDGLAYCGEMVLNLESFW